MAILPIRTLPDPILRQKAKRVKGFDKSLRHLVEDMIDTMRAAPGVGIAGNQVGVLLRVCVIELPEEKGHVRVFVNPEVLSRSGQRELEEGCLSYPGYRGKTLRSERVTVRAMGLDGKPFTVKAEGDLLAHALEHETDHLNGILYLDRMLSKDAIWPVIEAKPVEAQAASE
ncbi:MAG: peptide deformylase [Dehalococcoidia bacterium]|nr:peptide deformylase [Dehalococcoidia bacterium]